ncbi:MAG: 50S ribosomal protein L3 [Erysipelotrichaceae bacterium]|nr:50S ribosomal protein L3 [Erysipelotrichaceae bacterium]
MKGILGRKLGMTQVFTENGELIPVTVIEIEPNTVMQKKTVQTDGYDAIQLGLEDVAESMVSKPVLGQVKKAGLSPKRFVKEVRADEMMDLEVGAEVKADLFSAGDIVDVTGVSKGKGYAGTIARYNHQRGPVSHGGSKNIRHIGSLATTGRNNGRIEKNAPMPGHDGVYTTTNQNLEIIKVDAEKNYILVKGNVPGAKRGLLVVKTTVKPVKHVEPKVLLTKEA